MAILDFLKGVNPWFWSKNGNFFNDHWGRKQALLYYKNWIWQSCQTDIFYIGVNPRFWSKLFVCLFFFFGKIGLEIMSDDHLVKNQGNLTINKSFFLTTNHSACINFCPQSVSQSAMQSVSQLVNQSVN